MTIRDKMDEHSPHKAFSNIFFNKKIMKHLTGIAYLPKIKPQEGDQFYIIPREERFRPDKTSYKFYGTYDLEWVICYVNNIKDPFNDYVIGKSIIIPEKNYLIETYLNLKNSDELISE